MGVYHYIYAEVKVGNKWYNLSPLMRDSDGEIKVQPVLYGQSWLREAVDEMRELCYAHGRPHDLSEELRKVFPHDDDEVAESIWHDMTYKDYYRQTLFVINYGKEIKSRVKEGRPTRYQGYVSKYNLSSYEIGEVEDIVNWIHPTEYEKLSAEEKKEYTYYEWDEWDDWYAAFVKIVRRVDCLLELFRDWCFHHAKDANLDERTPTADYVRLIVERN